MIKETSTEEFEERRKHSPLKDIVYIIRNNLENGRHFLIKKKKTMYRIPSLHVPQSPPSGFCEIGTLHSFQKTFFGTKIRPSFIQENEKKYNLAAAVKYYFDSRVEDRDNIIVGIGRYPPGKNLINVVQEKLITDTFWPWADAEICIKRKNPQENYRAYMIVNGVFEKSLVAHALRGFAQELYHPIIFLPAE